MAPSRSKASERRHSAAAGPVAAGPVAAGPVAGGAVAGGAAAAGGAATTRRLGGGGRGARTRTALLDAGERLLARVGFDGLTTTAVAEEAGVSTGTFYGYFADKHALLAALFAVRLDDLVARVGAILTADHLLDHGLEQTMDDAVDLVVEGYRAHAPVLRAALARIALRDDLRELYRERHGRSVAVVARFIRRGRAAGLVRDGEADVLAHAVVILTQSLNTPVLLEGDPPFAAQLQAELARALTAVLAP
jgi:AcrR family transcriptional regulator